MSVRARRVRALVAATTAAVAAVAALALTPAPAGADAVPFGPAPVPVTAAVTEPSRLGGAGGAALGNRFVFRASTPALGEELWISDGTPRGTRLLKDIWPGADDGYPDDFVAYRGRVYFGASDPARGNELWVTDGTSRGTRLLKDLATDGIGAPRGLTVAGGKLFFSGSDDENGQELWVSDGTAAGTRLVSDDVFPGINGSSPRDVTAFGSRVVYRAQVDTRGSSKPYVSDGTRAGTVELDALPLATSVSPWEFTPLGSKVLFTGRDPDGGQALWVSGGRAGDARIVKDIQPGALDDVTGLTRLGGQVVFDARTAEHGLEPWVTDGTPGGTQLLRDVRPGPDSSSPFGHQGARGRVWFVADDGTHGFEVWSSDGTASGTRLVRDVVPGPDHPDVEPVGPFAGQPLFTLTTPATGTELWRVDARGRLLPTADLRPGVQGSDPAIAGAVANTLFYSAVGMDGLRTFALTLLPATVRAVPRSSYPRRVARQRRIVVPVRVNAPVGTLTLLRGSTVVGRASVRDGVARVRVTVRLRAGRHTLRARYGGSVHAGVALSSRFVVRVR